MDQMFCVCVSDSCAGVLILLFWCMVLINLMLCVLLLSWSVVHNHYASSPRALSACAWRVHSHGEVKRWRTLNQQRWSLQLTDCFGNVVITNGKMMTINSKWIGGGGHHSNGGNPIGGHSKIATSIQSWLDWRDNLRMNAMEIHCKFIGNTLVMKVLPMNTRRISSWTSGQLRIGT